MRSPKKLFLANVCTYFLDIEQVWWCTWRMALSLQITASECQCASTRGVNKPSPGRLQYLCVFHLVFRIQYGAMLSLRLDNNKEQKLIVDATTKTASQPVLDSLSPPNIHPTLRTNNKRTCIGRRLDSVFAHLISSQLMILTRHIESIRWINFQEISKF